MTSLDQWLSVAASGLSEDSIAKVRVEIEEHYGSAIASGATDEEAVVALGDAKAANRQYTKVLLTAREATMLALMEGKIPSGLTPSRVTAGKVLAGILLVEAIAGILAGMKINTGWRYFGVALLVMMALQSVLPLQTVKRARAFRWAKWVVLLVASIPLFALYWWAPICALVVLMYGDYRRMVLRRKLPMERWPKKLYV